MENQEHVDNEKLIIESDCLLSTEEKTDSFYRETESMCQKLLHEFADNKIIYTKPILNDIYAERFVKHAAMLKDQDSYYACIASYIAGDIDKCIDKLENMYNWWDNVKIENMDIDDFRILIVFPFKNAPEEFWNALMDIFVNNNGDPFIISAINRIKDFYTSDDYDRVVSNIEEFIEEQQGCDFGNIPLVFLEILTHASCKSRNFFKTSDYAHQLDIVLKNQGNYGINLISEYELLYINNYINTMILQKAENLNTLLKYKVFSSFYEDMVNAYRQRATQKISLGLRNPIIIKPEKESYLYSEAQIIETVKHKIANGETILGHKMVKIIYGMPFFDKVQKRSIGMADIVFKDDKDCWYIVELKFTKFNPHKLLHVCYMLEIFKKSFLDSIEEKIIDSQVKLLIAIDDKISSECKITDNKDMNIEIVSINDLVK